MENLNTTIVFGSVFVVTAFIALLTLSSPVTIDAQNIIDDNSIFDKKSNTGNKYTIQKSCGDSFLSNNEGGPLSQDVLTDLNRYLSQNPVAVGDEPLTDVKNVDGNVS